MFDIPIDFNYLKSKGKEAFEKEVKEKLKNTAYQLLMKLKKSTVR